MARILPLLVGVETNALTSTATPNRHGAASYLAAILDPFRDAWLAGRTRFTLLATLGHAAADIVVESFHGSIVLAGEVATRALRERAEVTTRAIAGVVGVTNELRVRGAQCRRPGETDADVMATLQTRIARARSLRGSRIHIDVYNGVVTLSGTARSAKARTAAFELAIREPGVRRVVSDVVLQLDSHVPNHAVVGSSADAA